MAGPVQPGPCSLQGRGQPPLMIMTTHRPKHDRLEMRSTPVLDIQTSIGISEEVERGQTTSMDVLDWWTQLHISSHSSRCHPETHLKVIRNLRPADLQDEPSSARGSVQNLLGAETQRSVQAPLQLPHPPQAVVGCHQAASGSILRDVPHPVHPQDGLELRDTLYKLWYIPSMAKCMCA